MDKIQVNTLPGFEDALPIYWVEPTGKIWSEYKKGYLVPVKQYNSKELKEKWQHGELKKEPYYIERIYLNNNKKNKISTTVHKLVALAFVPNPNNLEEINHIDKNTSNNNYTNLEWISKTDNIKIGLSKGIWQCDKDTHERLRYFNSFADAEREGYSRPNIIAVCKGRRKSAQNYFWEYD